jgi:zinc transporter
VLGDLHHDPRASASTVGVLRLYLDNHCLITARQEPLRAVESLRRAVLGKDLRIAGAAHLVIHLAGSLGAAPPPSATCGTTCTW